MDPVKYMKKLSLLLSLIVLGICSYAQEISQVNISGGTTLTSISLLTDREVLIRISEDGKVLEWGVEMQSVRNSNYYAPKLQPYMGRIEYYGQEYDSLFRGKLRSVGSSLITYYGMSETELKRGKIRTIGSLLLDYYSFFDNKAIQGKLSAIGGTIIGYYTSFDDRVLIGKLKTVGATTITYYSSFDDKYIRGKIKSIGPVSYNWYTSLESQYGGGLKSGSYRQSIGGVTYILQ